MKEHSFRIDNKIIGSNQPTFFIAEAGVNHNGSLDLALKLVDHAASCGADCVKFQTFQAENLVTLDAPKADYQLKVTDRNESQFEMLKKLELSKDDYVKIINRCKNKNIIFLSTPYNDEDIDFLVDLNVSALKIASGQIVETPFLKKAISANLPLIVSSGMATLEDVKEAVNIFRSQSSEDFAILQCNTNYPTSIHEANIKAMVTMRNELNCLTGYSDHTEGSIAIMAAVANGASIIEKHFTLDRELPGPDHTSSINPQELKILIQQIRTIETVLGSPIKKPTESELLNIPGMRRSLVAKVDIEKDQEIKKEHISFKRPATGIAPKDLDKVLGKKINKNIKRDELLTWNEFN